jgi:3-dehydroquinate dehydratase/shikimate dehydrogenase
MICVSIGCGQHGLMIAEHKRLAGQGARLVELRVDYINGEVDVQRLLTGRPCPVVVACRRKRDGGMFSGSEEDRLGLLRAAIAEGADYVDLEEDVAAGIPRVGASKRIISFHDFRCTPEDLEEIYRRMCGLDPDIVKICTMANRPADNLRMMRLVRGSKVPTIGFCMGEIGLPTRVLCGKLGSPWTYATFQADQPLAPGQLSYQQMTEIYRYDGIRADTEVYGVIADPVGHSLSPLIHNAAFRKLGMNRVYVPIRVSPEHLAEFIETAAELGIRGLSVTIPHKEAVIGLMHEVDEAVRGIGACNTVVFRDGRRSGYNTDYAAAMGSLEEAIAGRSGEAGMLANKLSFSPQPTARAFRSHSDEAGALLNKTALVLGAGGVGRAIAFGLVRRGAQVVLCDGLAERATQLASHLGCRAIDWDARHDVSADVVVNCTPIGMHPKVDATPLDKHSMRPAMVVFDAVYNPENTLFINDARACNCKFITGVDMFVRQAAMQFKLFTGQDAPEDVMRDVLNQAIAAAKQ